MDGGTVGAANEKSLRDLGWKYRTLNTDAAAKPPQKPGMFLSHGDFEVSPAKSDPFLPH